MSPFKTMKTDNAQILVIGCGKMGSAIVLGWLKQGVDGSSIHIVDPNVSMLMGLKQEFCVNLYQTAEGLPEVMFDFVMVALKPQQIERFLPSYEARMNQSTTLISIAAGITSRSLRRVLPKLSNIIRIMPNTPALIQKGVLVAYGEPNVGPAIKDYCQDLFSSLGHFYWIECEDQLDAVTAVSGSGPAYLFYFMECFIAAAKHSGLPTELAKELAINTVLGASYLVESEGKDPTQLRIDVTSPKGTTQAALNVLMQDDALQHLMHDAIQAAKGRSQELAKLI